MVKNPPAMWETQVQSLGWGDIMEKEMETHSSILAWRISWTEYVEMGSGVTKSQTQSSDFHFIYTHNIHTCTYICIYINTYFLVNGYMAYLQRQATM